MFLYKERTFTSLFFLCCCDKEKAYKAIEKDRKLTGFYIPFRPENTEDSTWSVIRKLSTKIGEELTNKLREIARENQRLQA